MILDEGEPTIDPLAATWATQEGVRGQPPSATVRGEPRADETILVPLPRIPVADEPRPAPAGSGSPVEVEILRVLGAGGMGEVLLARQRSLAREIAVKRPRRGKNAARGAKASLVHEARITGALEHPNVIPIHALGLDDEDQPILLMKRVEGTSLHVLLCDAAHAAWSPLLRRHGDRTTALVEVLIQVCNALELAHARQILHRDIKPENVMVGAFGEVYLLDWGIATDKSLPGDSPVLVGTPAYLAPEMMEGDLAKLDERTDVYLLGATLHELLTGKPRHVGKTVEQVLDGAIRSAPFEYGDDVPRELAALCNAATAKEKADRPATVVVFRERLVEFLRHGASRAMTKSATETLALLSVGGVSELKQGDESAARTMWRAMGECRFGFLQALREWPENADARAGLQGLLELMIEREIEAESPVAARAYYDDLPEPRPDLAARIEALAVTVASTRAKAALVLALQREMDASTTAKPRIAGFAVLFVAALCAGGFVIVRDRTAMQSTMESLMITDFFGLFVFGAAIFFARKRLFVNVMGRRLTWTILLQSLFILLTDVLVVLRGGEVVDAMVYRAIGMATGFGVLAVMTLPSSVWLALLMTGFAFAIALAPPVYGGALGLVSILAVLGLSSFLFATGRIRPRPGDTLGG